MPADRDHVHDRVGALERGAEINRGMDGRVRAVLVGREPRDLLRCGQPVLVDVVQRQLDLLQFGEREQIAHEITRELDGPGTDECHAEHLTESIGSHSLCCTEDQTFVPPASSRR